MSELHSYSRTTDIDGTVSLKSRVPQSISTPKNFREAKMLPVPKNSVLIALIISYVFLYSNPAMATSGLSTALTCLAGGCDRSNDNSQSDYQNKMVAIQQQQLRLQQEQADRQRMLDLQARSRQIQQDQNCYTRRIGNPNAPCP